MVGDLQTDWQLPSVRVEGRDVFICGVVAVYRLNEFLVLDNK